MFFDSSSAQGDGYLEMGSTHKVSLVSPITNKKYVQMNCLFLLIFKLLVHGSSWTHTLHAVLSKLAMRVSDTSHQTTMASCQYEINPYSIKRHNSTSEGMEFFFFHLGGKRVVSVTTGCYFYQMEFHLMCCIDYWLDNYTCIFKTNKRKKRRNGLITLYWSKRKRRITPLLMLFCMQFCFRAAFAMV